MAFVGTHLSKFFEKKVLLCVRCILTLKKSPMRFFRLPALLSLLCIGSCIEEPATPSWDIRAAVPLIDATYNVERFIVEAKDSNLVIAADGSIDYIFDQTYNRLIDITDSLRASLADTTEETPGDLIQIPNFNVESRQTLGAIEPSLVNGVGVAIPSPITLSPSPAFTYDLSKDINSVSVKNGAFVIRLANTTGVDFTNLTIEVRSLSPNQSLGVVNNLSVARNSTATATLPLDGATFGSQLSAQITGGTIPAQSNATIQRDSALVIGVARSSTMTFTAANIRLLAQSYVQNGALNVVGGKIEALEQVILKRGTLRVTIQNSLPISGQTRVLFPAIRKGSDTLSVTANLVPNGVSVGQSVSVADFVAAPKNRTTVPYLITTTINPSAGFVSINTASQLRLIAQTDSFTARYAKGVIWDVEKNQPAEFDIDVEPLEIGSFSSIDTVFGNVFPTLAFNIFNYTSLENDVRPSVQAYNVRRNDTLLLLENGQAISRRITPTPEGTTPTTPNTVLNLDSKNSNAVNFVLRLPDTIYTKGKIISNPNRTTGSAFDTSTVGLDIQIKVPLRFSIDTLSLSDSADIDEEIDPQDLQSFTLTFRADSGIPINTEGRFIFLDSTRRPLRLGNNAVFSIPRQGDPTRIIFNAAPVNADGLSSGSTRTEVSVNLNGEEIALLKKAKIVANQILLNTKRNGSNFNSKLRSTDSIRLRTTAKATYKIGN
jgi:hypothetical protein